ncbi:MAG TPA: PilZ domain-containing protein [Bacillota bacterium]|nr:PilZ domain-containing protein [Bacillota bacterium]
MYPSVNQTIIVNTEQGTYKTIVAEILDDEILIAYPVAANKIIILPEDQTLEILFVTGESQYRFFSKIIGRKRENIALYRIQKPLENNIAKIQRRENFRVPATLDLTVKDMKFPTVNISGGGLLFTCPQSFEIKENEDIPCTLIIPQKTSELIKFQARVARITPQEDSTKKNVGVEFTRMDEKSRTQIIQYCFEKQRQNRLSGR